MITNKKNQHYIPKFYLRHFSFRNNKKQIGIYNIKNKIFFQNAKLKSQGSKQFFYGEDGVVEEYLSNIENKLARVIIDVVNQKQIPPKNTTSHINLLLFIALTDLRNPMTIDGMKESIELLRKSILDIDSKAGKFVPEVSHELAVKVMLSSIRNIVNITTDLDCKILINKTTSPFITSDYPIVKYNQFLEKKDKRYKKVGYGLVGLQIFIPINAEILIVLYDSNIYKLGDRKKKYHKITNNKNVDDLNILQFLNCIETVYFNELATEQYIKRLHKDSMKFHRANIPYSELSYLLKDDEKYNNKIVESGFKNLVSINKTNCEIGLCIDGLKIHSNGKHYKLDDVVAQLRPHARNMRTN